MSRLSTSPPAGLQPASLPMAPSGRAEVAVWPAALGLVSIALAASWVAISLWGMLGVHWLPAAQSLSFVHVPSAVEAFRHVLEGLGLLASGLLLIGGLSLLRRRRVARGLHLAYAILALIVCLARLVGLIGADTTGLRPGARPGFLLWGFTAWAAITLYPVIMAVWFSRPKVKRAMAGWAR